MRSKARSANAVYRIAAEAAAAFLSSNPWAACALKQVMPFDPEPAPTPPLALRT